ncbi:hypothetical protein ABK046_45875, partial [Streptomyces caeruleatus]
ESFIASVTSGTLYTQTAGVWITAPLNQTSDSAKYPISSNTVIIRKTAKYKITCRNSITPCNNEYGAVAYSINGGTEQPANYHLFYHDSNTSGS